MRGCCSVAEDYLGLTPYDYKVSEMRPAEDCGYFSQIEDDEDHPSVLLRVCGNCIHFSIVEDKPV